MALVLLGFGSGGCARPAATGTVDPFTPGPERAGTLLDSAEIRALATLLRFEDRRIYDDAAFQALVDGAGEEVRRRGAMAAGRTGDPAAGPFLLRLLRSDPSHSVRADAAFAIGQLGDGAATSVEGLEAAVSSGGWVPARAEDVPVVVEAIAALGKLGGERARSLVHEALSRLADTGLVAAEALASGGDGTGESMSDEARGARVAAEALLAVWKFDGGGGNVSAAAPYLRAADPRLRWRAAYALMRGGDPGAVPRLLELGADEEHRVRAYTARALTATSATSAGSADQARRWLTAALADPHPHVRINAVRSLGGYGDSAPIDAMAALLRDPDPSVGFAAAGALAPLGAPAAPYLSGALADTTLPVPLRGAVLEQLGRVDPPLAEETVRHWASQAAAHRYFAARALPSLHTPTVLELAGRLAGDEDRRVAVAALTAASAIGVAGTPGSVDTSPEVRSAVRRLLRRSLDSPDPVRRAAAAQGLAGIGHAEDLDPLLAAFRRSSTAVGREGPGAREAALVTLSALREIAAREGVPPSTVAERLFSGPRPDDRWILRAASALGDRWGAAPEAVAGEGPGFYEDIVRRYVAAPVAGEPRPRALIETPHGPITLELASEEAPLTVHNFLELVGRGYFDDGVWHRVIPNFVLQDGAPGGAASGGPGWTIRDEINRLRYDRGTLGMALSGPDTGGSQWFITHSPQPHLDGGYTVFGRVVEGMDAADRVLQGEPIPTIRPWP